MAKMMKQFHTVTKFAPERCPVHLHLPWLYLVLTRFAKQVKSVVKQCFSSVEPRVLYTTNELLSATNKDVLHALQKSNVIYQLSCHCDSRYVGCNSQRLQDRIKQHVLKSIHSCSSSQKCLLPAYRCKCSTILIPILLLPIQPLDYIFYKILRVRNIMKTVDCLMLPKAAHLSTYLLLKPLLSKLLTPPSADKNNSRTV